MRHYQSQVVILSHTSEMNASIQQNTLKGFGAVIIGIALFAIIDALFPKFGSPIPLPKITDKSVVEIIFPPVITDKVIDAIKEKEPNVTNPVKDFGTEQVAGKIKAVNSDDVRKLFKEFADFNKMSISMSKVGKVENLSGKKVEFKPIEINKQVISTVKPNKDEDVEYAEIPPAFDIEELQRNITYPELALKVGIEGNVVVKVIISKTGFVKKLEIIKSDSELLNDAAIIAIRNTIFTPASQNGKAVDCPVVIPVKFRIR
jgi:TonB family protein